MDNPPGNWELTTLGTMLGAVLGARLGAKLGTGLGSILESLKALATDTLSMCVRVVAVLALLLVPVPVLLLPLPVLSDGSLEEDVEDDRDVDEEKLERLLARSLSLINTLLVMAFLSRTCSLNSTCRSHQIQPVKAPTKGGLNARPYPRSHGISEVKPPKARMGDLPST